MIVQVDSDYMDELEASARKVEDLKEVIRGRDEGIAFLEARVKKLELQLAQAIAREGIVKAPKGFVGAKKRRKHEERTARAAVKEARHV
jgi:hypothetical protein